MARINTNEFAFVYYHLDTHKCVVMHTPSPPKDYVDVELNRNFSEQSKVTRWGLGLHVASVEAEVIYNGKRVTYLLKDHIGYPWFFWSKIDV